MKKSGWEFFGIIFITLAVIIPVSSGVSKIVDFSELLQRKLKCENMTEYNAGPLSASLPAGFEVKVLTSKYAPSITGKSKSNIVEIVAYPFDFDSDSILSYYFRQNVSSMSHSSEKVSKVNDIWINYYTLSDYRDQLRGELICLHKNGQTIIIYSYGASDEYQSVKQLSEYINVMPVQSSEPEESEIVNVINSQIKKINSIELNIVLGNWINYRDLSIYIKDVKAYVDHKKKEITISYYLINSSHYTGYMSPADRIQDADKIFFVDDYMGLEKSACPDFIYYAKRGGYKFKEEYKKL